MTSVEDQALPFRSRYHLSRQNVPPVGGQKIRVQDQTPVLRCGTEWRKAHQGREERNGDGNRDGGGDEKEYEFGDK